MLLGHALPLLVNVQVALIVIELLPAIVSLAPKVTLPETVNTALCVRVPVYPDVTVNDNIVLVLLIVLLDVPNAPLPLNITSSVDVGAVALLAPPSVSLHGVGPVAFQLLADDETPTQYFVAIILLLFLNL